MGLEGKYRERSRAHRESPSSKNDPSKDPGNTAETELACDSSAFYRVWHPQLLFLSVLTHALCSTVATVLRRGFRTPASAISGLSHTRLCVGLYWVDYQPPQVVPYASPGFIATFCWSFPLSSKAFQTFNLGSRGSSPLAAGGLIAFLLPVAPLHRPALKQMLWLPLQCTLPVPWHFLAAFGCSSQLFKAQL